MDRVETIARGVPGARFVISPGLGYTQPHHPDTSTP